MSFLKSRIEDRRSRIDDRDPSAVVSTTFFPFSILDLPSSSFCPSSILYSRLSSMPFRRLFVGIRQAQDGRLVEVLADDLQADGHAAAIEAARQRQRRQAGEIDGDGVDIRQ